MEKRAAQCNIQPIHTVLDDIGCTESKQHPVLPFVVVGKHTPTFLLILIRMTCLRVDIMINDGILFQVLMSVIA